MSPWRRLLMALAGAAWLGVVAPAAAQTMGDYCYTPPSVGKSLPPNVMIVMDSSGSMLNYAYDYDGSNRSTGYDPTHEYYGYFKPDLYYTYSSQKFRESRPKSGNTIAADEWDGNFLNWLTMRRIDVVRRVLTGGDFNASSNTLVAEYPDAQQRGDRKRADGSTSPAVSTMTRRAAWWSGRWMPPPCPTSAAR